MKTHATRGRWAHLAIAFAGIIVTAVLAVAVSSATTWAAISKCRPVSPPKV
jgi:hypothetical protein